MPDNDGDQAVDRLRCRFPWPESRPEVDTSALPDGWFCENSEASFRRFMPAGTRRVVEIGSWMGKSTRWLCRRDPDLVVFAVDTWKGSPSHRRKFGEWIADVLQDAFFQQSWDYRRQIVPIKADALHGLKMLHQHGVVADVVYIDAQHDRISPLLEAVCARICWPHAVIIGDDYFTPPVRRAAHEAASILGEDLQTTDRCWALTGTA